MQYIIKKFVTNLLEKIQLRLDTFLLFFDKPKFDYRTDFLYIAALHHYPYRMLLFYLGKSMLWEIVSRNEHV